MLKKSYSFRLLLQLFSFVILGSACQKQETPSPENTAPVIEADLTADKTAFAKILAKAMKDPAIRAFMKTEAMQQVDKDYDIIYHLSKDKILENGRTFEAQLDSYADTLGTLREITDRMPLLTIFIPTINGFNANNWKIESEIPIVAVRITEDKQAGRDLLAYDANGQVRYLTYDTPPTGPAVVVKENERLDIVITGDLGARSSVPVAYAGNKALIFRDQSFDGRTVTDNFSTQRTWRYERFDPKVIYAFERTLESPRDYIYYGIDPSTGVDRGPFNNQYAEFLTSIKINDYNSKSQIVDWTDGELEFQVNFLFLKTGGGSFSIMKNFPCSVGQLFRDYPPSTRPDAIKGITLTYNLPTPIEVAPWDMEEYGDTWKVTALEYDPGSEATITTSTSTTFGYNFGLDVGGEIQKVKIGIKFGISQTTTRSETFSLKITGTSDLLGEALFEYATPIILSTTTVDKDPEDPNGPRVFPRIKVGITREINLGKVSLSIEPKKRF